MSEKPTEKQSTPAAEETVITPEIVARVLQQTATMQKQAFENAKQACLKEFQDALNKHKLRLVLSPAYTPDGRTTVSMSFEPMTQG